MEILPAHVFTLILFLLALTVSLFVWLFKKVDRSDKRSWRTMKAVALFISLEIELKKEVHPEIKGKLEKIKSDINIILNEKQ